MSLISPSCISRLGRLACGADFRLIGPDRSSLTSSRLIISVCAVRTGCGKDSVVRRIAGLLKAVDLRSVVVRHPMPYGDLSAQAVQRFATLEDCDRAHCTIEEREEYEQHINNGVVVYAGVDYGRVLARGGTRSRRDHLGWRQQRLAVLSFGSGNRLARSASSRTRVALSPGRDQPAPGTSSRRQ